MASSSHLRDVFQEVWKMSWKSLEQVLARRLGDVFESAKLLHWRCLQGNFKICLEDVFMTSGISANVCYVYSISNKYIQNIL